MAKSFRARVDRSKLWSVQTPQTFRVEVIRRAIAAARRKKLVFTDDTAACELIGQPVRLVTCAAPNPKVTVPADLPFIESLSEGKFNCAAIDCHWVFSVECRQNHCFQRLCVLVASW